MSSAKCCSVRLGLNVCLMSKHLLGVIGDSSFETYQQSFETIIIIISNVLLPLSLMDTTVCDINTCIIFYEWIRPFEHT